MGTSATRTCPECGSPNSGLSLFCSECGASLSASPGPVSGDADGQTTTTFRTVDDDVAAHDPYATQSFRVSPATSQQITASGSTSADTTWSSTTPAPAATLRDDLSRRGLVLGWIAALLILLVIAFFAWSSLLDPGTRDSITGIFG
jgi:hypothetical protein